LHRVLLDQGMPRSAAGILRDAGLDACHVGEAGLAHASDESILHFARAERRVCCTLDADFHRLLAVTGALAPSVVRVRIEGLKGAETAGLLLKVLAETGAALAQGAAVTVTWRAVRVRCLPLTTRK